MKLSTQAHSLRFFSTACLLLVTLTSSSAIILAAPAGKMISAEITVSGESENAEKPFVKLNGEPAMSGRTFLSQSTLETSANISADVNLPGVGRVRLLPGTILSLGFSENNITGKLHAGKIRVFSSTGTVVKIETPDNILTNDSAVPGDFSLDLTSGESRAVSESGTVFFSDGEPVGQAQTTTASRSILLPVIIYAAIVGASVVAVLMSGDDDDVVSPVR